MGRASIFKRLGFFSLVELLVVIAIFSILVSLLAPSLGNMYYRGQLLKCQNNLKGIHLGVTLYADDYNDVYARYGDFRNSPNEFGFRSAYASDFDLSRRESGSIIHLLRPYFENMNETFLCEGLTENTLWDGLQLNLDYKNNDAGHQKDLPAGYLLNFNATARYRINHTYSHAESSYGPPAEDAWSHPDNIMKRVGDEFRFKAHSQAEIVSYDIIASDYMFFEGAQGAHVPPDTFKNEVLRRGFFPNFAVFESPHLENNLVFTDGSVLKHESLYGSRTRNQDYHLQWADANSDNVPYFPAEYNIEAN